MDFVGKVPPHNIDAEQSVLGAILLNKDCITEVTDIVTPSDFYKEAHLNIYAAMLSLYNRSEPVDLITLTDERKRMHALDMVVGIA